MKTKITPAPAKREQLGLLAEYYDSDSLSAFGQYLGGVFFPVGSAGYTELSAQGLGTSNRRIVRMQEFEVKHGFSKTRKIKAGHYVRVIIPLEGKEIK